MYKTLILVCLPGAHAFFGWGMAATSLGAYMTLDKVSQILENLNPMLWSLIGLMFIRTMTEIYKCRLLGRLQVKQLELLTLNG
jgi:hypothetical protein